MFTAVDYSKEITRYCSSFSWIFIY